MTPEEFVECFAREKKALMQLYFDGPPTAVSAAIDRMNLGPEQRTVLREVLDGVLTDTLYTVLLGLDGEASIGGEQRSYVLTDDEGNLLTRDGAIEASAYERFHGERGEL